MPILTSDGKQVEKRYTSDGKNVRTAYNVDGDVVFEEISTAEGAFPQSFKSRGKALANYRIYGNTVQDGTPTPENPVEVQGCGVETGNGYKIDITSTNALENTSVTTPVYIGQSPLYKIGDYADYVDYKRGGVVRWIDPETVTVLSEPTFEPIADLPKIPTFAPQTVIDADMEIKPSKIWYKYKPQSYLEYFKSLRTGKIYQVKIPKFAYDTTTDCIKQLDNAGLVAEPSTNLVEGRDDYLDIPVFKWWHCNYRRDSKGQAIITALEGDPEYSTTGTADVGSLFMSRYRKWEDFDTYSLLTISDSPHPELGLQLMKNSKDKDGNDKGYMIFSAYYGLYSQPDVAPLLFVSYNAALTAYQAKGAGYWGQDDERLQFVYDNIMLKYATKSSQTVFAGCASYNYQYDAAYKDSATHTYFPLTTAQAANIEVGSAVVIGYASLNTSTGALNKDRGQATVRSKVTSVKVLKKETVTLDGVDYVGIYLDIPAEQAFDTLDTDVSTEAYPDVMSPAMLSTMPWWSGSTDAVVGKRDGSLGSNTDSKHPFRIMGIEAQIGAWDVVCDTVMRINADYSTDFFQAPKGVAHSTSESTIASTYTLIGTMDKDVGGSTSFWVGDVTSPNGTFYPSARGNGDSKGCGDYCYRGTSTGWREVLRGSNLGYGSIDGCAHLLCNVGRANADWYCAVAD